jgi:hypothetical protein
MLLLLLLQVIMIKCALRPSIMPRRRISNIEIKPIHYTSLYLTKISRQFRVLAVLSLEEEPHTFWWKTGFDPETAWTWWKRGNILPLLFWPRPFACCCWGVTSSRKLFFWKSAKRSVIIHDIYQNKMCPVGFARYELVFSDATEVLQLNITLHIYQFSHSSDPWFPSWHERWVILNLIGTNLKLITVYKFVINYVINTKEVTTHCRKCVWKLLNRDLHNFCFSLTPKNIRIIK